MMQAVFQLGQLPVSMTAMSHAMEVEPPKIEYAELAPLIIMLAAGGLGVLVEAIAPRGLRRTFQLAIVAVAVAAAIAVVATVGAAGAFTLGAMGSIAVDAPTVFSWGALLLFAGMSVILMAEREVSGGESEFTAMAASVPGSAMEREASEHRLQHTEIYPLTMFAVFGMMLFVSSSDLLTMFVALEIFSLPLYLMVGLSRRRRLLSQEAAVKYFLLGALASAMFLFGTALLYGYAGGVVGQDGVVNGFEFASIDLAISISDSPTWLLLAGMVLISVGLLFKLGAVPFHSWTPDVYTGSPTPITAFMSVCTKLAAIIGLTRVFFVALGGERWDWQPILALVAVATMAVGALVGLVQTDIKRMLAYSSIAHAGFLLVAVVGAQAIPAAPLNGQIGSVGAILVYMVAYGFASIGAFGLLMMVRKRGGETNTFTDWRGIGRKSPLVGILMTVFMLSMAGIPLTAGFVGKVVVFSSAWRGGYWWLVVAGVAFSLITAAYYLRVLVVMFLRNSQDEEVEVHRGGWIFQGMLIVAAISTIIIGIIPEPLMILARDSSFFLR